MIFWQKEKTLSVEEKEAEGLLGRLGFEIIKRRPKGTIVTKINGQDHMGKVEANYLVTRGKETFVIFIPGSGSSADPTEPALRRRLLELTQAFTVSGALLLDAAQGECHEINFRFPRELTLAGFFRLVIAVFIVAAVVGIIWLLVTLKLI
ncbi:hypothetical protein HZB07_02600 [Candidatus Saganbacteria bacterium]|nr:hypothetical protein [Candidatus Saganbacteria bacterium]